MTRLGAQFWRLYTASATSNLADGMGRTALPLLGAHYTRNPVLISGLVTFAFLPWLLFALPSGVLVDRTDRRRAMAAANGARAVSTGVLAVLVLAHSAGIATLYAVAFALGAAETVYDSAVRAILPQVVANEHLDTANGWLTVEESLGQTFLGGPGGSALFVVAATLPLAINAGGFALAAVLITTLRGTYRPPRAAASRSVRRDIGDGVRWLRGHRLLRELTLISAATAFANTMPSGILVLYVLEVLHLPSGDYGWMIVAAGAGGLLGGVTTPPLARRFGRPAVLTVGAVGCALFEAGMALTANGVVAAVLFGGYGVGVMTWNVLTMSLRQALIPHELFGRVQGAYRTLVWGAIPLGSLTGGLLARGIGIAHVFLVAAAIQLVAAVALGVVVHAHRETLALDAPTADAAPADLALHAG